MSPGRPPGLCQQATDACWDISGVATVITCQPLSTQKATVCCCCCVFSVGLDNCTVSMCSICFKAVETTFRALTAFSICFIQCNNLTSDPNIHVFACEALISCELPHIRTRHGGFGGLDPDPISLQSLCGPVHVAW